MNTKNILIVTGLIIVLGGGIYWYLSSRPTENDNYSLPAEQKSGVKLKVANFSGKLEQTNEGCFVDGECYVVIDKKHVTIVLGRSQEIVGTVQGVESFGDLSNHIGEEMDVYAQDKGDGTYTLYGSEGFYIKLK